MALYFWHFQDLLLSISLANLILKLFYLEVSTGLGIKLNFQLFFCRKSSKELNILVKMINVNQLKKKKVLFRILLRRPFELD